MSYKNRKLETQNSKLHNSRWVPSLLNLATVVKVLKWFSINQYSLTHWGPDKMEKTLCRQHFQMHFLELKCLNFHSNLIEICFWESSWQKSAMVHVIAWHQTSCERLPESKLTKIHNTMWLHQATIELTHCGLATPYGDIAMDQHWLR